MHGLGEGGRGQRRQGQPDGGRDKQGGSVSKAGWAGGSWAAPSVAARQGVRLWSGQGLVQELGSGLSSPGSQRGSKQD